MSFAQRDSAMLYAMDRWIAKSGTEGMTAKERIDNDRLYQAIPRDIGLAVVWGGCDPEAVPASAAAVTETDGPAEEW